MQLIELDNISLGYGAGPVLNNISWAISRGIRAGLVGANGAGKSTLMRVIAGQLPPDAGKVRIGENVQVGYLPQDVALPTGKTVWEVAAVLPPRLAAIERQLNHIETQLADPAVYNTPEKLSRVMARQEETLRQYDDLGIANFPSRVQRTLAQLGFSEADYPTPVEALSGGQKKLVALAQLVLASPEVLLLDEPDNHLDIDAKHQLEAFIHGYAGAVIIISHDRYLLDEVVTTIVALEHAQVVHYPGTYSRYLAEKDMAKLRQEQLYVTQQKRIQQIEEAIQRFELLAKATENNRHAKQARSRRKMLDRMAENGEIIEQVRDRRLMDLGGLDGGRGSRQAIKLEGVSIVLGDEPILLDVDLLVRHGERVGLIGGNGAGKSVLFKTILGEIEPYEGGVTVGNSTKVGYYAQEHQTLEEFATQTPITLLQHIRPMYEGDAVSLLLKFAFTYEQARQPIQTMSGGERSRLQLLRLLLHKPNLLLLDEPTNNLDTQSIEVLEEAIDQFEGTVFVISHDRYFLDNMVDRLVVLQDGSAHEYLGGYTDYLAARR